MKGIVFTEFLEMVEEKFGYQMANDVVEESQLPSKGIYTAVGTYPHTEMVSLVVTLSKKSGIALPTLLNSFGKHLFSVFKKNYEHFFKGATSTFSFLSQIDSYIHVEVLKLYPDAQLPKFYVQEHSENKLVLIYVSDRSMADLAHGLMEACTEHFGEKVLITKHVKDPSGREVVFELSK